MSKEFYFPRHDAIYETLFCDVSDLEDCHCFFMLIHAILLMFQYFFMWIHAILMFLCFFMWIHTILIMFQCFFMWIHAILITFL